MPDKTICDGIMNKILDSLLNSIQEASNRFIECLFNFELPPPKKTIIKSFKDHLKQFPKPVINNETSQGRLFSDLYKNLTNCHLEDI